ncbi:MAG: hypothetical protein IJV97_00475 [Alphaproteobacteria bacterium]|nr:hypothetical protein [Alphaproteobacteria bacterium]
MASIRQIKYSKDFDIEDIDIKELETQETRENIADDFDREQAQSIFDVYNKIKGDSTKEAKFKELYALMSDMNSAEWAYDGKENKTLLNEKDGVQTLRIKNLGGSGLDLAITDDKSFIFEQGGLTDWQVASFASFFADHGMTPESFEGVKDLKVTNAKGEEIGTFEQVYASYTDYSQYEGKSAEELSKLLEGKEGYTEYMAAIDRRGAIKAQGNLTPELQAELEALNRQIATFEPALVRAQEQQQSQEEKGADIHASGNQQEDDNQSQSQQQSSPQTDNDDNKDYELPKGNEDDLGGYDNVSFNSYIEGAEKDKKPSLRTFKSTLGFRGGIMRVDKKCIRQRRMPDGSYVISFYNSEEDKLKDGKVDPKTGIAKHTKRCALRYYPGKPPTIGVYIPQGSKVEGGVAKGALGTLKNMGYKYFTMPPSYDIGGEVFGSFMTAAGDQLMCPRLKRSADDTEGCDMGNDNLNQILKGIKDKDEGNDKDLKLFKMRLVEEINSYYKASDKLRDSAAMLAGDVKFDHWASSTLPRLNRYIKNGTEQGWNAVDVACAYAAQAKVAEAIHKGELTYADENGQEHRVKYDYLAEKELAAKQDDIIDKMFKSEMRKAEPNVIAYFKENCHAGSSEQSYDDEGNQQDQYNDKNNKNLSQRDFDNASRKLVDHFRDDVAGGTFSAICGKYPGSEKTKDWRPERTTGYTNIKIGNENNRFGNLHGNRRRQQSTPQRQQSTR